MDNMQYHYLMARLHLIWTFGGGGAKVTPNSDQCQGIIDFMREKKIPQEAINRYVNGCRKAREFVK